MTEINNVTVKNSTISGGANTGSLVGDAVNSDKTNYNAQIKDTNVSGCTVKGSYANGGAIGSSDAINMELSVDNYTARLSGAVKDVVLEGGVFVGGVVGSADNEIYTETKFKGGAGDGYSETGERTAKTRIGTSVNNVTIKGEEGTTLAAGGVYGRMDAPDSDDYENAMKAVSTVKNVEITGAYAKGNSIGWCCEVDPETGKVTKDCDAPFEKVTRGQIGRAGTTTEEVMRVNSGRTYNIDKFYADIDSFAQQNNLKRYKNFEHVYQDSNGYLYWTETGTGVMCNTFVNAIDAYKVLKGAEIEKKYCTNISMGLFDIPWLSDDDVYSRYGYCSSQNGCPFEVTELLSGLDAVNVYTAKSNGIHNDDGLIYGQDVPYEYYYTTADGKWHKLTMSTLDAKNEKGERLETIVDTVNSIEEYIKLHKAESSGEFDNVKYFCVEDITAQQAMDGIGAKTGQPPKNQGFVKDGVDGHVEDIKEQKETGLTGLQTVPAGANATLQDYKNMLVLTNFLKANIYRGTTLDTNIDTNSGKWVLGKFDKTTGEYKGVFSENPETEYHMIHGAFNSYEQISKEPYKYEDVDHLDVGQVCPDDESCYINWYFIPGESSSKTVSTLSTIGGKVELTEENLKYYKDNIVFYDKDQLAEKSLEKLINESWKMVGESNQEKSKWVEEIITAIGGKNIDFVPGESFKYMGQINMGYAHVSFDLGGKTYCIPLASSSVVYDESQIFTTDDVKELSNYLDQDTINDTFYNMKSTASRGSCYFAPLYSENGEIKTWLYIGNLAGLSLLPYDANENELGREIPIPVSRDTDPKTFIDYIKTNGTNI